MGFPTICPQALLVPLVAFSRSGQVMVVYCPKKPMYIHFDIPLCHLLPEMKNSWKTILLQFVLGQLVPFLRLLLLFKDCIIHFSEVTLASAAV